MRLSEMVVYLLCLFLIIICELFIRNKHNMILYWVRVNGNTHYCCMIVWLYLRHGCQIAGCPVLSLTNTLPAPTITICTSYVWSRTRAPYQFSFEIPGITTPANLYTPGFLPDETLYSSKEFVPVIVPREALLFS